MWRCSTHYMRTTLYLYSHTQQSAILSSSSFWHHTKIRRFTMVCRSPHLLFSVRCYKKAIEKNSCVFSGASMWKIAKKTEISKASMKPGQTPWTFPHTNSTCACGTPSCLFWQKILWQQHFVPRFSLFCYVYPKWAISFQTQVFLYGNSPHPLFFNFGPPFFQDWLIFSQPAFLKRPLYFRGKPSPFFYRRMCFLILGRSVRLKKKNHKESWDSRPWYPRTALKLTFTYLD